ncbi:HECT-domain-containing protein [Thelephora ganbajun]|uniref:HECT-domain-containing protein n=1 Tax=Thelephora ganbajun TaxID=370292 RepID=A0ACB6ZD09_THEGA|nr:HECT-domain-containing protein [Thelephora ganbajun]
MLPLFGADDRKRRNINLGGRSTSSTHTSILDEARLRREERQSQLKRQQSATRIQAWWRGKREARVVRTQLRHTLGQDPTGINGLRAVVLIGQDEESLKIWSRNVLQTGENVLYAPVLGPDHDSWVFLIKRVSLLLLSSISKRPHSDSAEAHSRILLSFITPSSSAPALGGSSSEFAIAMTNYLLSQQLYAKLGHAVTQIPTEKKDQVPSLPHIISLITSTLSSSRNQTIEPLFTHILTIPLLPSRLPLAPLKELSSHLPLSSIHLLSPYAFVGSLSNEAKAHLIANLMMFTPPRYSTFQPKQLDAHLSLLTSVLYSLPPNALEPPSTSKDKSWVDEGDSEDEQIHVEVVSAFASSPMPKLDTKTLKRLQTLPSPTHISTLLGLYSGRDKVALFTFCSGICQAWPARQDKVLATIAGHTGGGFVRELYREHIRSSPLGAEVGASSLADPNNMVHWPPLLLLIDLYTQALLTMGDDEFFGTGVANAPRNPLSLGEVISFSRKLLNIAFVLYWREDQTNSAQGQFTAAQLNWNGICDKATRCLQAIHARDSRKHFTPRDHWLVTSQIDVQSFVQAAIFEEQQLSENGEETGESSSYTSRLSLKPSRSLSKRQVAYLSPRLAVLNNIPFAIPFETRVSIFRHFVLNDMMSRGRLDRFSGSGRTKAVIRRDKIAQDGFDRLQDANLKQPLEIVFVDQFGQEEAGIDGGGVFKEFLTSLAKEVFDSDRGLWLSTEQHELYPNPHSYATDVHSLAWFRFVGRILGKALYEGILVDVAFAGFFLAKWLGKQSYLDDLASLDSELYQGLIFLKHYSGDLADLTLNFTVAQDEFGIARSVELIQNGSNIPVTKENRLKYIYLVSLYKLSRQIKKQSNAFFDGLSEMIDPKWLRMFNQQELQILLGGVDSPIDVDDLRANTQYGGLYAEDQPTIQAFWRVVGSFTQDQKRALLRFVTSCSRPPLLGFKELVPKFAIRDAGRDNERLPTASTCVNLLKLPMYTDERILRAKLLQAINSGAGFDLS